MKLKRFFDRTLLTYVALGFLNFVVCTLLMYVLYNRFHVSEHLAPLVKYGLGNVLWFLLCRYVIFEKRKTTAALVLRFVANVAICYILSFYVIAPLVGKLLLRWEWVGAVFSFGGEGKIGGNCAMTVGVLAYGLLNYFGQRYAVFNSRIGKKKDKE